MSGIDIGEYSLFNTGNDAPWPDDYIEFIKSENVVIHRGSAIGFYRYKYDEIIVDRDVDAEDLIDMGLAKKISLDICEPWQDSFIEFNPEKLVLRNFLAPLRGKKNYIVFEEGKFYVVNKYYLLINGYATVSSEEIYKDVDLPKIDYNAANSPWKEDGIRFITDKTIEKSTKPSMYVEKRGSMTTVRSLTAILGLGYAVRECDAKKHFFPQYCVAEKTKREYKGETLTKDFVEGFFSDDSPIIVKDNFKIENLYELMICYHCAKQSAIPFGKEGELYIEDIAPAIVEEYKRAIEQSQIAIDAAKRLSKDHAKLNQQAVDLIGGLTKKMDGWRASENYVYWQNSLNSQKDYRLFFIRAIVRDNKWDNLLKETWSLIDEFKLKENEVNDLKVKVDYVLSEIAYSSDRLFTPKESGGRKDTAKLNELLEKAKKEITNLTVSCNTLISYLKNEFSRINNNFNIFNSAILSEANHIKDWREELLKTKEYISKNKGQTAKGSLATLLNKKLKPWDKNLEFIRKDYLIERYERSVCDIGKKKNMKVSQCYKVALTDRLYEILFPEALVFVGLAKNK